MILILMSLATYGGWYWGYTHGHEDGWRAGRYSIATANDIKEASNGGYEDGFMDGAAFEKTKKEVINKEVTKKENKKGNN